jgi:uncharacterized protein (DUF2141 family)
MRHLLALSLLLLPFAGHAAELRLTLLGHGLQGKTLYVALHASAAGFPGRDGKAIRRSVVASGDTTVLAFAGIPAGEYAAAVYADMNGNGELDSNFFGIPQEPVGMSRDAKGRFGPPGFSDAVFAVGEGVTVQTLHIK